MGVCGWVDGCGLVGGWLCRVGCRLGCVVWCALTMCRHSSSD